MKVDVEGRVYCTALAAPGLRADGTHLGIICTPEIPANLAFGGADMRTLFFTARTSVYTLRAKTPGVCIPGSGPRPSPCCGRSAPRRVRALPAVEPAAWQPVGGARCRLQWGVAARVASRPGPTGRVGLCTQQPSGCYGSGEHSSTERGRRRRPGVLAAGTAARLGAGCVALGRAARALFFVCPQHRGHPHSSTRSSEGTIAKSYSFQSPPAKASPYFL